MHDTEEDKEGNINVPKSTNESTHSNVVPETNKKDHEETNNDARKDAGVTRDEMALTENEMKSQKLFSRLIGTLRGWPFSDKKNWGKDRNTGEEFRNLQEVWYRIKAIMDEDREINVQELFFEVAIDNPTMFQGYTHYDNMNGFSKKERDRDMDIFMEYVRMIEPENPSHGWGGIHFPHPKWIEFRKRVDREEKDSEGRWCLRNVFKEAAKITNFEERKKGKHYQNGFGFVETKEDRRDIEKEKGSGVRTKSANDKLQNSTMEGLINSIRGYPFGEINMLGKDRKNSSAKFDKENEFIYRKNDITKNEDDMWYLKEVFWEAAIDNRELFCNYTHFSISTGFVTKRNNDEFDMMIEYIRMIEKRTLRREENKPSNPHSKLYEFRKRIDRATLDTNNRWSVHDVFPEAACKVAFRKGLKGKHYKDGLGLVLRYDAYAQV